MSKNNGDRRKEWIVPGERYAVRITSPVKVSRPEALGALQQIEVQSAPYVRVGNRYLTDIILAKTVGVVMTVECISRVAVQGSTYGRAIPVGRAAD